MSKSQTTKSDSEAAAEFIRRMTTPPPVLISARLYEGLKDYLAMETDMKAAQLMRRLREAASCGSAGAALSSFPMRLHHD